MTNRGNQHSTSPLVASPGPTPAFPPVHFPTDLSDISTIDISDLHLTTGPSTQEEDEDHINLPVAPPTDSFQELSLVVPKQVVEVVENTIGPHDIKIVPRGHSRPVIIHSQIPIKSIESSNVLTKEPMPDAVERDDRTSSVDASRAVLDSVPVSVLIDNRKSFRSGGGSAPGHHSSQAVYFSQQRPQPTDLTVADSEVRINAKFNFNVSIEGGNIFLYFRLLGLAKIGLIINKSLLCR